MTKAKILIIDDEEDIRESLSDILKDEGYEVVVAENAATAKKIKSNIRFDLILLDIWMPDCDGISLLKQWAKDKEISCPVIMMSGHGTIDTAIEATKIGAFDFLEKPISLQKLLKTISLALKKSIHIDKLGISFITDIESPTIKVLRERLKDLKKEGLIVIGGKEGNFLNICIEFLLGNNFSVFDPKNKLDSHLINKIQEKGKTALLIKCLSDLSNVESSELRAVIKLLINKKIKVIIVDENIESLRNLVGDEWIFDDHYFKIPIDNDMDMISEFSNLILNYYLSNNINIGYKEFDTSALNLMRLESNFLKIDELDQFILNLIQNVEAETITAEDLNFSVATVLSNDKKIEYITPKLSNDLYKLSLKDARDQFEKYYFEFHIKSKLSITELSKKSGVERTHLYRKLKKLNISTK
jgi:two-component system nitrogen regulation response regulator NtrX|tara:strand:+ start:7291 stop:8532 length:1242 start_codon:yes stop_codon:yes gene_type:complete